MIFFNPVKDFFLIASKHAKGSMIKDLNFLEAEMIMAEEALIHLKREGMTPEVLNSFENKLDDLKKLLASKKKEFYTQNNNILRRTDNPDPARYIDNKPEIKHSKIKKFKNG